MFTVQVTQRLGWCEPRVVLTDYSMCIAMWIFLITSKLKSIRIAAYFVNNRMLRVSGLYFLFKLLKDCGY